MALVLVLGMAQCKKQKANESNDGSYTGVTKNITFTTGGSSKVVVDNSILDELHFKWEEGDKLYVYGSANGTFSDGQYCGSMDIAKGVGTENGFFSGTLDNVPTSGKLRFFYSAEGLFNGTDKTISVDLSSQDGTLAGLATKIVASAELEVQPGGDYSAVLEVPYSVVKFDLSEFGTTTVTMTGMTNSGLTVSAKGKKNVTAGTSATLNSVTSGSTSYFVAAIPDLVTTLTFIGNSLVGSKTVTLSENTFHTLNGGGSVPVPTEPLWAASVVTIPVCAIHKNCASSGGVVTGTGVEEQGVCWGTNENPTINDNKYVHQYEYSTGNYTPKNTTTNNTFTGFMSSLADGTTYHVRAYIKKGSLVKYGDDVEFRTKTTAEEPVVTGVDLGLPNGTIWATCNLGAANEYDYGDYYMWGDNAACTGTTSGKCVNCDWQSYRFAANSTYTFTKYCPSGSTAYWYSEAGTPDNKTQLDDADDCVQQTLGGDWRMPTAAEWQELYENTTKVWTKSNGFWGWRFTGTGSNTDKSIFIPAAGYRHGLSYNDANSKGFYWKSSLDSSNPSNALTFAFYEVLTPNMSIMRFHGFAVRPVR